MRQYAKYIELTEDELDDVNVNMLTTETKIAMAQVYATLALAAATDAADRPWKS